MTNMIKLYKIRIGEKVYEVEVEEVTEKDGNIETSADSKDKQKIDKNENPPLQGETGKNEVIKAPMQGLIVDVKVKTGEKVKAGVDALQLFDSWGGVLSAEDYQKYSWPYTRQIVEALSQEVPVIVFAKGCWYALEEMSQSKAAALGVDWTCSPEMARKLTGGKKVLQGNLDPAWLLAPIAQIKEKTQQMIRAFGKEHYIANLGHGILPEVPVEHARAFIEAVKNFKES